MKAIPVAILSLVLLPGISLAQEELQAYPSDAPEAEPLHPTKPQPSEEPPPPPAQPPASPGQDLHASPGIAAPQAPARAQNGHRRGQWVFTDQYGWVWMPYGRQYVDEGVYGDDHPYQYVYCAGTGWAWLAAPWLWGWGPYPFFGFWGPWGFGWYRGLSHAYGWGNYRGGFYGGRWGGGRWGGGFYGGFHHTRPIPHGGAFRGNGLRGGGFHGGGGSHGGAGSHGSGGSHGGGGGRH